MRAYKQDNVNKFNKVTQKNAVKVLLLLPFNLI